MQPSSFRKLEVWQLSMTLCEDVYALSARLPNNEFDLRRQMRRSAVSIPCNIAEGYKRSTRPSYINHVSIASGSLGELDTQLEIAIRLNWLATTDCVPVIDLLHRVSQMLWRLERTLRDR